MKYVGRGLMLRLCAMNHTDKVVNLYSNISYQVKSIRPSYSVVRVPVTEHIVTSLFRYARNKTEWWQQLPIYKFSPTLRTLYVKSEWGVSQYVLLSVLSSNNSWKTRKIFQEFDVCWTVHHCVMRCITGNRWIDIWLVFINLDFEMRFDNFTRATCILYIDLVETLNFQLRCLVEKVAHDKIQWNSNTV